MAEKKKISVAIATYNEEVNIAECLRTVTAFADEIIVVDGGSTDKTVEVAEKYGARVVKSSNPKLFHINKIKAINECKGDWILQLDADERVSHELAEEIEAVIMMNKKQIEDRVISTEKRKLFNKHQKLVEERDGVNVLKDAQIVAFYLPRINYFLGGSIRYAGTYPDGVIRLFKRGFAQLPAEGVHEQLVVNGQVAWLTHDLIHMSNPSLTKYLRGARIYTDLQANNIFWDDGILTKVKMAIDYLIVSPWRVFFNLYIRHKGVLDGWRGFLFSLFSSWHYPVAFIKSIIKLTN